MNNPGDLHEEG